MPSIFEAIPNQLVGSLSREEFAYLEQISMRYNGFPPLKELWKLMDEPWLAYGCDPLVVDERIQKYYEHPVWLLNGLFVENDSQSIEYRSAFVNHILSFNPSRVADYGGGFGTLARMLANALPGTPIEVVEPYPHALANALAASIPNISYVPKLSGTYDLLIATDVFEHVLDPLSLVANTSSFLGSNGIYMMANCFYPVIKCHLPQNMHFNVSWDSSMAAMGFRLRHKLHYACFYELGITVDLPAAKTIERKSKELYQVLKFLPSNYLRRRIGSLFLNDYSN
jgi:hypothetical protein